MMSGQTFYGHIRHNYRLYISQLSDLAEIQTHPSFYACPYNLQECKMEMLYNDFSDVQGWLTP